MSKYKVKYQVLMILTIIFVSTFLYYLSSTKEVRVTVKYKYRNDNNYYFIIEDQNGNGKSLKVGLSLFANTKKEDFIYIHKHDLFIKVK